MRDRLFRARILGKDRWVFGSLLIFEGYQIFDDIYRVFVDVESFSIGEFTGLTDAKNQKIFEDDILMYRPNRQESPKWYVVEFENGSFGLRDSKGWFVSFNDGIFPPDVSNMEVYGNIHDNHELLKKVRP